MVPKRRDGDRAAVRPSGFFALRTPLLPMDELFALGEGLRAEASAEAMAEDEERIRARLLALVARPDIREALFLASPSLDDAMAAWRADAASPRADGVTAVVHRYICRMTSRATPFALFAGCSTGSVDLESHVVPRATELRLGATSTQRRHARLDQHYVSALATALERDEAIRDALRYRPNDALFASAGQLRYPEARLDPVTRERSFHLVAVEATEYLEATLTRARRGAMRHELAAALVDEDVSLTDALAFIDELIASQLLVSELAPFVTGPEALEGLLGTLRERAPEARATATLGEVHTAIRALESEPLGVPPERYRAVARSLESLPVKADLARLFQVDLYKGVEAAVLGRDVVDEVRGLLAMLPRIARHDESPELLQFRRAFEERYDQAEVPLVAALDDERGIGFAREGAREGDPSPLLAGLPLGGGAPSKLSVDRRDAFLATRVADLARQGISEWRLTESDVARLASKVEAPLPDAFAVMLTLLSDANAPGDAPGDTADAALAPRFVLHGVSGPSGAPLLGRFCHGDPALHAAVVAHLREEEALAPDAVFAEVVHLPEGRLGNILGRPVLRTYEIPYLGRSGADEEHQIPLEDLRVSVRDGRVVLRSARLDREVIPRLTTAHNYAGADLGVYRFLCSLQRSDDFAWTWGALAGASFLPRVVWGSWVLSPAQYRVAVEDLPLGGTLSREARFAAILELRRTQNLPRRLRLVDGDNILAVDLDDVVSVEGLLKLARGRTSLRFQELLPAPENLCVEGPGGRFAHEIVVPFVRERARASHSLARTAPAPALVRRLPPGSEVLYAKLYAGPATADRVLTDIVSRVVAEGRARGDIRGAFFIRYGDPRWHLRVRLFGDGEVLAARVLPRLHQLASPWLEDGRIARIQLDTYERELERYGGDRGMTISEALFMADSDAVLELLPYVRGEGSADLRWRLALLGMDRLLADLAFDVPRRLTLMRSLRASFGAEHGAGVALERELGVRFRRERHRLDALLEGKEDGFEAAYEVMGRRSSLLEPLGRQLEACGERQELACSMDDLAASYLHMHANRMLLSEQRAQELVLYDFLLRHYESALARGRTKRLASDR